jgi:hypothetical protein
MNQQYSNIQYANSGARTGMIVLIVIIVAIILLTAVLGFFINDEGDKYIKNENPLCLTASCSATSNACGTIPFIYDENSKTYICKTSLFTDTSPNVNIAPT